MVGGGRYVKSGGGRYVQPSYEHGALFIDFSGEKAICREVDKGTCIWNGGAQNERYIFIYSPKAKEIYFMYPDDSYPSGYEPLRVFK